LMMSTATVTVQIDEEVKRKADAVLRRMGYTAADLIEWTMTYVAEGETIPFEIPHAETIDAMEAARRGETAKGLMSWLDEVEDD
jgi:addiction module RelB/DinJ family antitoxin